MKIIKGDGTLRFRSIRKIAILSIFMIFNFIGCDKTQVLNSSSDSNLIPEYKILYDYADKNKIELNSFSKRDKVLNVLNNLDSSKKVNLKKEHNLFSEDNYSLTNENTGTIYYGDLKDNKPNGIGVIYVVDSDYGAFIKYAGYFEKGILQGYGMEFNVPPRDTLLTLSHKYNGIDSIRKKINYIEFEGEFEDGMPDGKLNSFHRTDYDDESAGVVKVGKFTAEDNGNITGTAKEYIDGALEYDGEYKDGNFHGKGKLYFKNSKQIKYDGNFTHGKYDGKGTLYDESGKKIYSGKWNMGDYK